MSDEAPKNSQYSAHQLPENIKRLCDQHLEDLKHAKSKNSDLFESQINYIAGGALSITPFIVDKFIDLSNAKYKGILFAGWGFIILALLFGLVCAFLASKWLRKSIAELSNALGGFGTFDGGVSNQRNNRIEKLNMFMLSSLLMGIVFFFIFISINISTMSDKKTTITNKPNTTDTQTRGYSVTTVPNIVIQGGSTSSSNGTTSTDSSSKPQDKKGN